jgi:glycogen operon protein
MNVDGFRFDLASTLARGLYEVNKLGGFFDIIHQDPILSQVKLIAEPWDLGPGGYMVGNFPAQWSEWNGKYRDAVRHFWKGDGAHTGELATRVCGSPDLYAWSGKRPHSSINFITCHDGFTLQDWVSYNEKHNTANGENNRDGSDDNISWNCGVEGTTEDPAVLKLRESKKRSCLATLMLSQGVPMLLAGDERGNSQDGNNNGYCQDNELTWLKWDLDESQESLLQFVRELIRLRREQPVLQRRRFFSGESLGKEDSPGVVWFSTEGIEMPKSVWNDGFSKSLGMLLVGGNVDVDAYGEEVEGDSLLVLFNGDHGAPLPFVLPDVQTDSQWEVILTTGDTSEPALLPPGSTLDMEPVSVVVLRLISKPEGE